MSVNSVDLLILDSILQVLNTGGQLTLRAAPAPPPGSGPAQVASPPAQQPQQQQVQQPNNRIMAQQQQQNQYAEYQQLPPAQVIRVVEFSSGGYKIRKIFT